MPVLLRPQMAPRALSPSLAAAPRLSRLQGAPPQPGGGKGINRDLSLWA